MYDNHVVNYLKKHDFEVNEDNYLSLAYPTTAPDERTPEMLAEWRMVEQTMKEGW
jgi:hypothetical protein